jgi:hypothetical protein
LIQWKRFVLLYALLLQLDSDLIVQIYSLAEIDAPVVSPYALRLIMKDFLNNFQRLQGFESSPMKANSLAYVAPPELEMIFKFQKARSFEHFPPAGLSTWPLLAFLETLLLLSFFTSREFSPSACLLYYSKSGTL